MPSRTKQKRRGRKLRASSFDPPPLDVFFAEYYPQFEHDPTESASHEFYRLCDESGWNRGHPEREGAHQDFKNALVKQFNTIYGVDEDDLADWQNLCFVVHVEPVPDDLGACREAIRGTFVNLVDTDSTGEDVQVFENEHELSQYTRTTGKFFPKENAYAGGLLRYLLRHILHPGTEDRHRSKSKRRL